MFHPFRQNHQRRVHSHSSGGYNVQSESKADLTLPLKLFMQQDQQQQQPKQPQQRPNLWRDDSSVDMSVYTTESKTTVQYSPTNLCYGRMGSVQWPSQRASATAARTTTVVAKESRLLLSKVEREEKGNRSLSPKRITNNIRHQVSSPSAAPSTPLTDCDHQDDKEEVEDYFDYDHRIQQRRQNSLVSESVSRVSSNPSSKNSTAITKTNRGRYVGPIDLDDSSIEDNDSVAEEREDEIVRNCTSVFRAKGSYPDVEPASQTQGKDSGTRFWSDSSSSILPDEVESEGRNSPIVWTDHEDDDGIAKLEAPPRLSEEDSKVLNRSYHQSMQSISFHSIDENKEYNDYEYDDDSGAVLLTQEELQKHLNKVQNKEPMPSSYIGGYDEWKQEQEYQRRYFESLQRKVHEQKRRQRQQHQQYQRDHSPRTPDQSLGSPYNQSAVDSVAGFTKHTYGDMDESVASTIATEQTEEPSVRQETYSDSTSKSKTKRRWKILPKFTGTSKKKSPPKKVEKVRHLSPPRTPTKVEEPSEVANMSLAPLNTMLGMNVGSHGERRELVSHYLQEERKKQMQAEQDKTKQEWMEQERIQRMKEKELQRQRELHQVRPRRRCASPEPIAPSASKDSTGGATTPLCCASFDSDLSASKSVTILSSCILCDDAERTHIAMPCMHFCFCGGCVNNMSLAKNSKCPVCGAGNVTFARVHT